MGKRSVNNSITPRSKFENKLKNNDNNNSNILIHTNDTSPDLKMIDRQK